MSLHELDGFAADLKALRTRFNQLIARIDLKVKALVKASPERKQNLTQLCTITGVRSAATTIPALEWRQRSPRTLESLISLHALAQNACDSLYTSSADSIRKCFPLVDISVKF